MTKIAQYQDAKAAIAYVLGHAHKSMTFAEIIKVNVCVGHSLRAMRRALRDLDSENKVTARLVNRTDGKFLVWTWIAG